MGRAAKVKSFFESAMTDFTEQLRRSEGIFNKYYDVDILKGVADGIYNQIDLIHQLTINETKAGKDGD